MPSSRLAFLREGNLIIPHHTRIRRRIVPGKEPPSGDLLMRLLLTAPLLVAALPWGRPARAEPYPQLIATCYPDRGKLPSDFAPPAAAHDFVDKARLPAGARVLSAARATNGTVWVVTDRGALASRGD